MNRQIVCLAGLSGSGKSTVLDYCGDNDIAHFYTGDVIPPAVSERDKIDYGDSLEGNGFIELAVRTAFDRHPTDQLLVMDSLRAVEEWDYVRSLGHHAYLMAILCNQRIRMERVQSRDGDLSTMLRRDRKELGIEPNSRFNVGALIGMADFYLVNSGDVDATYQQLNEIFEEVRNGIGSEVQVQ